MDVINQEGKVVGSVELKDEIFVSNQISSVCTTQLLCSWQAVVRVLTAQKDAAK